MSGNRRGPRTWVQRATALLLSWVFTATTVWASAPPLVHPLDSVSGRPVPGLQAQRFSPELPDASRTLNGRLGQLTPQPVRIASAAAPEALVALAAGGPGAAAEKGGGSTVTIFGPQKYVRTTGAKNVYTTTVSVPASVRSPFTLHVKNGEANGTNRVSSAWITVNGVEVASPSDFNPQVPALDRTVALTLQTTLVVTLASKPGSYLYVSFLGTSADATAPRITVVQPAAASTIATAAPQLRVTYQDLAGAGEPAASGVDTSTLAVLVDGLDRAALFSKRSTDASVDWPATLAFAEGAHSVQCSIKDFAGNTGSTSSTFVVDLTPPFLRITAPANGGFLGDASPPVVLEYGDNLGLDTDSLRVMIDGVDRTALFAKQADGATAALAGRLVLPRGSNQIVATIADRAGTLATATASFNVDLEPPTISITQPTPSAHLGTADVEVTVRYQDDQKLDLDSFVVKVDGTPVQLSLRSDGATGFVHRADGSHTITASIADKALHNASASVTFFVDTGLPELTIVEPPAGAVIALPRTRITVAYSDEQAINPASLRILVDGVDRTPMFIAEVGYSTVELPLGDNPHQVSAHVEDLAGHPADVSTSFTVDTTPPTGKLEEPTPGSVVGHAQVTVRATYDDAGVGVDPASVRVFVDGQDVTASFAVDRTAAVGSIPLGDGPHEVRVTVADHAGNGGPITGSFVVDTRPPQAVFAAPKDGSFIKTSRPAIRLTWDDGTGSGVDRTSVHVFLQPPPTKQGSSQETEITSWFVVGEQEATATVPADAAFADGAYGLRATLEDRGHNPASPTALFEVDTVPPTGYIESPAPDAALGTHTPDVVVRYKDERSGIDTKAITLSVDDIERTALLTSDGSHATATLTGEAALSDGTHRVTVNVADKAGNGVSLGPVSFTVDTIAPTVSITDPPHGAYLGAGVTHVRADYGDVAGSGIDRTSVKVTIDGTDRTSEFAVTDDHAEATFAAPLGEGGHTVHVAVLDFAGNPASDDAHPVVDTQPPSVSIATPTEGSYLAKSPVTVTGTVQDADPQVSVVCSGGTGTPQVTGGQFTCEVGLAEGENTVEVTASDRLGHQGTATRRVKLDTQAPQVTIQSPVPGYTRLPAVDVSGTVTDASPVTVTVEGIPAVVEGSSFTAKGVPVGAGPQVTLHALATDAAGNVGPPASVTLKVDRQVPLVVIDVPANDAYLKGPSILVAGRVSDESPVLVEVNGTPAPLTGNTFSVQLPVVDGTLPVVATAHDDAGNVGQAPLVVHIDSKPPEFLFSEPADPFVTNATEITVSGTVVDASPIRSLEFRGAPVPLSGNAFSFKAPLTDSQPLVLTATDAAGNVGTGERHGTVDRNAPEIEITGPTNTTVITALPVIVQGFVWDETATVVTVDGTPATRTGDAFQASFAVLPDSPHTLVVVATDAANNQNTRTVTPILDLTPPTISIGLPLTGSLTSAAETVVSGTVVSPTPPTVTVNGVPAVVVGNTFTATVPLVEDDNPLHAVATSAGGHTAEAPPVFVTRDSTKPQVSLTAPETISKSTTAKAVATASDAHLTQVVMSVNGVPVRTFTAPPFEIDLVVPTSAKVGDPLTVSAVATDAVGNSETAQRLVTVVSQGMVAGRVLADETSLPLAGATVTLTGTGGVSTTTNGEGEYTIPVSDAAAVLSVSKDGLTAVERSVSVATGVGTVPVDARLTTLPPAQTIGPDGAQLTSGPWAVTVPAGAAAAETPATLVALSPRGLPGLLPLGWSPVAAAAFAAPAIAGNLSATVGGVPARALVLASYNASLHEWALVASGLVPAEDGHLDLTLPGPGSYVLAVPDAPELVPASAGTVLLAAELQTIPETAASTATASPSSLPPSGGTAKATLLVQSPSALPSGTVVAARVTETFTLASGESRSLEERLEDVVLYQTPAPAGAALAASLPVTPSRTFKETELSAGNVHLDILRGREGVRGKTGGSAAVQVTDGDVSLSVPAQSLPEDTVVDVEEWPLSGFLPAPAGLTPLAEAVVDLSDLTLSLAAELSFGVGAAVVGDTLLVARVERVNDVPKLTVVSLATIQGDRIVTQPTPGLPGVTVGGRYVLYRSGAPVGFIVGKVSTSAGPVRALVLTDGLPFVAISDAATGAYTLASLTGGVTVTAQVPGAALAGSGTAEVTAGASATLNLLLAGTVTTATVVPADNTVGLERGTQVQISSPVPLNPATVNTETVRLQKDGQPIGVRLLLSGSGKTLAVIPQAPLEYSTSYTLVASGLADVYGGLVQVPSVTFRVKDDVPPVYNTSLLRISMPDANGLVTVSAPGKDEAPPAGTFPPGTQILIINSGNGVVLTLTAGNDGEVAPQQMPASISDVLLITITDPQGNVTTIKRSQFVELDAEGKPTGWVGVGPGGGTVTAVDGSGTEMEIPEGALEDGVKLKISGFDLSSLPEDKQQTPDLEGANFGSGLKVESEDEPVFKKEVKLSFPVPDFSKGTGEVPTKAEDAYFYVCRRVEGPVGGDGKPTVLFETIDEAFLACPTEKPSCTAAEKKVTTASPPFSGYVDSFGLLDPSGAVSAMVTVYSFLMWTFDHALPGRSPYGAITGKVQRLKAAPETGYEPIANAVVVLGDTTPGSRLAVAKSQADGTYTLVDSRYTGGVGTVSTTVGGVKQSATLYEVLEGDPVYTPLQKYQHVGTANLTFAALAPPPPPSAVTIRVLKAADQSDPRGLVTTGTELLITLKSNAKLMGLSVGDQPVALSPDASDKTGGTASARYTPAQPGSYTVTATALTYDLKTLTGSVSFLVINPGGGNTETLQASPPSVIDGQTVPKREAKGVPVSVFPQVSFTEPVKNLVIPGTTSTPPEGTITLNELNPDGSLGEAVPFALLGIDPNGQPVPAVTSASIVTSLTVQPTVGLKFNTGYRLALTSGIVDLDVGQPNDPKHLLPYETSFTTFGPEAIGGTDQYGSPGIVVLGNRAYLVQNYFYSGVLKVYDTSDPVSPQLLDSSASVSGRPVDIAGIVDEGSVLGGEGNLVAVATGPTGRSIPSNIYLFDARTDQPQWIGAASVTTGAVDGFINRLVLRKGYAYALTYHKGIQAVDLTQAVANFNNATGGALYSTGYWNMVQQLNTEGMGFGQDAVQYAIKVPTPEGQDANMYDLRVGDFSDAAGNTKTLALATGMVPLATADLNDPPQQATPYKVRLTDLASGKTSEMSYGSALDIGQIGGRPVAILVGAGTIGGGAGTYLLAVVDMTDPAQPQTLAIIPIAVPLVPGGITGAPVDLLLRADGTALVGTTKEVLLVNLSNPADPRVAGRLTGIGGRLAVDESGLLFGTARSIFGGDTALGGVRTAALGYLTVIENVREDPALLDIDRKSIESRTIEYRAIFPLERIETSELEITKTTGSTEALVQRFAVTLGSDGRGSFTVPAGISHPTNGVIRAQLSINRDKEVSERPRVSPRVLNAETFDVEPSGPEEVAVNGQMLEFAGINAALADRLEKNPDAPVPALTWAGRGLLTATPAGRDGLYSGELAAIGPVGIDEIRLMKGDTVLARTGPLTITPGPPWSMELTAGPPLQTPMGVPGEVPADGKSEVLVTLKDVKDDGGLVGGNIVDDGTPIAWSIVEGDGELLGTENSVTAGGRATVRYRAGIEPGRVTIRAALPHPGLGEAFQNVVVTQAKLIVSVTDHFPLIEASVNSEGAGLPADGADVGWSAGRGNLAAQGELRNGHALASWAEWPVSDMRTLLWRGRFIPIGVTVGRAMAGFMYDTQQSFDKTPGSGLKLRIGADRLAPPSLESFVPSTTTLEIAGGEPGATVQVVLGSSRFPVVEPLAAYSFDSLTDGVSPDLYGRFPAEVSGEVTLDTSDEVHRPGTYKFAGSGRVSVPHAEAFALQQNLGFGGWVYFDTLTPGQKLVEKAGAYSVQLVSEAGEPRLEFSVTSGGQRARVLSRDAVAANAWLQFAAQFRGGVLTLALGDNDMIAIGGTSGPADVSTAPLVIGEGLTGLLDEVTVYDFSQETFLAFTSGETEKAVTLDQEGSATLDVEASETYAYRAVVAVLPPAGSAEDGFRQRLRMPPVRIYQGAEGPEHEGFAGALKVETEQSVKNCAEGIGLGEGELWSQQMACDVSVGLIPGATTPQVARDLAVSGIHIAKGKHSVSQFVKVGFSVAILAASVVPAGGDIGRVFSKVQRAISGTKAEAVLAREALEKVELLAKTPGIVIKESGVAGVLAAEGGDLAAQDALRYLLGVCETSTCLSLTEDAIHAFERVGTRVGHDELAKGLVTIAKDGRFGMDVVERMVGAFDRTPTIGRLSADALEGLAVFIKHAKGQKRLWRVWDELTNAAFHGLPPEQAQQVAERLFGMLKQGEMRFAETAWWHNFVALGAGTSRHFTSTRGFFHALEQILKEAPEAVISVDARVSGFLGRPDLLVRISVQGVEGIVQKEFKAIGEGYLLRTSDIAQLRRIIKAAKDRARVNREVDPDLLRQNLQRLVYVFRGPVREDLKKQLLQEAQKVLRGKELRPLAQEIYNNVQFVGTLPF